VATEEWSIRVRVAGRYTIRRFEMLRGAIEALRDKLVMICSPVLLFVVQQTHLNMNLGTRADFELLRCSSSQHNISGEHVRGGEGYGRLHPQAFLEAHHGEFEALLNLLIFTCFSQLRLINRIAIIVPRIEGQVRLHLGLELFSDWFVFIHVHIFHQITDTDLSGIDGSHVNNRNIVEHRHVCQGLVLNHAIDFLTLVEYN